MPFLAQICPKRLLGFEIQKTNVGIRSSILEILCVQIFRQSRELWICGPKFGICIRNQHPWDTMSTFRQNKKLWIFGLKFAQKQVLGSKFQKCKSGFWISILEVLRASGLRQNIQLWIFGPKVVQKWFLGSEFRKAKSVFGINTSNITCMPIFSQNRQPLIFCSKFGEIA